MFLPKVNKSPPLILRDDFSGQLILPIPVSRDLKYFYIIKTIGKPDQIFIQSGDMYYICSYLKNPVYYFKYLVYASIYLLFLGFILLTRFLQRIALRQRYEAEKKIAALQLLLLRNQLDPHFTFNAINSISASILQEKPEEANANLLRLSKLMRSCVEYNDRLSRSLGEELDFVNNYLKLIKSRMNEDFLFSIVIDENVDLDWQVPKMVTQIYVENAIKHGLNPLQKSGVLRIGVKGDGGYLVIEIEDNGIGRKKAAMKDGDGTGKGMATMEQFYAIFNKYNTSKIRYEILDLKDTNNVPAGTKICIFIPINLKYRFYEG